MTKYCSYCKTKKDKTAFYTNKARKDGLAVYCKECASTRSKEEYKRKIYRKECTICKVCFLGTKNAIRCHLCSKYRKPKPISGYKECVFCGKDFPYRDTLRVRSMKTKEGIIIGNSNRKFCDKYCQLKYEKIHFGERCLFNKLSREVQDKLRLLRSKKARGKKLTIEQREARSKRLRGEKSHFWKGGKTKEDKIIRASLRYRRWRETVFQRDDYTCQECKIRGGRLQADHIKPFAFFPELRFSIENGRTLCETCHKKTSTYLKNRYTTVYSRGLQEPDI